MATKRLPTPPPEPLSDEQLREAVLGGGIEATSLARITEHLMVLAGGPEGMARRIWAEFNSKKCTPATRQRILDMMLDSLKFQEKQNEQFDPSALGHLSKEDLEKELLKLMGKLQSGK